MKAGVLSRCLQIHIQHDISSPPHTPLFAVLEKSDREASQLAPSVPLLSYRRAAGCAGLKGSHWWAVRHRAKALLSNCMLISDGLLLPFLEPLHPSSFNVTMRPLFFFTSPLSDITSFVISLFPHLISPFPWMKYWFKQATLEKTSSQIPLQLTQVCDYLWLSVLIWALWGPRDLLPINQAQGVLSLGFLSLWRVCCLFSFL